MSDREYFQASNTGKLVSFALTNSAIHFRGRKNVPLPWESFTPKNDEEKVYFLFPSAESRELTPKEAGSKVHLIIPDGNWSQAARIANKARGFPFFEWVKLPEGTPPPFKAEKRLRHNPHPERICTAEAIVFALSILEGDEAVEPLLSLYKMQNERVLTMRQKL